MTVVHRQRLGAKAVVRLAPTRGETLQTARA
jgi:hypothetical protein